MEGGDSQDMAVTNCYSPGKQFGAWINGYFDQHNNSDATTTADFLSNDLVFWKQAHEQGKTTILIVP